MIIPNKEFLVLQTKYFISDTGAQPQGDHSDM